MYSRTDPLQNHPGLDQRFSICGDFRQSYAYKVITDCECIVSERKHQSVHSEQEDPV